MRPTGPRSSTGSRAEYRAQFGGDEGQIEHPISGEMVPVSLAKWKNSNPDDTYIIVRFVHSVNG